MRIYRGIPFAAPPVGELRWQAPRPVAPWQGVRKATAFGNRCMQAPIFSDMIFRDEVSEDCLYLNVWTPAKAGTERLPVMVWIYGGGFQAGSASEPRQDGEKLAGKGVVVVSFNYRLGVFGFFAHPELTKESGAQRLGQLRPARSGRGAAVGEEEHRRVRRRSGQGDHLRRIGRLLRGERAHGLAARAGPVPPRHRRERRVLQQRQRRAGAEHAGGERGVRASSSPSRSAPRRSPRSGRSRRRTCSRPRRRDPAAGSRR